MGKADLKSNAAFWDPLVTTCVESGRDTCSKSLSPQMTASNPAANVELVPTTGRFQ